MDCIDIQSTGNYTDLSLPNGFIPSATFVLWKNDKKYLALVDQKPESGDSELFTRRYVVKEPLERTDHIYDKRFTQRKNLIIGTMAQFAKGWDYSPIIYSRKGDILFCSLSSDGFEKIKGFEVNPHWLDFTFNEVSEVVLKTYNK